MTAWPVKVERLAPDQAVAIYCASCGWTGKQDSPENGAIYDVATCEKCGMFTLDYCYEEATRCGSCKEWIEDYVARALMDDDGSYCSRRCQFQAEYARTLSTAKSEATP